MPHSTAFDDLASLDPLHADSPSGNEVLNSMSNLSLGSNPRAEDVHKFGTLFAPSTPRASPEAGQTPLPQVQMSSTERQDSHMRPGHHRAPSTSSQSSDFGAFVSVSASDDPLAGTSDEFEDTFHDAEEDVAPRSRSASTSRTDPSRSFFDQFASDARERSSATRNLVLDELLLHQDDPMYFLAEGADKHLPKTPATSSTITQQPTPVTATPAPLSPPPPMPPPKSPRHASKSDTPQQPPPPVPKLPPPPRPTTLPGPNSAQRAPVITPNYLDPAFDLQHDVDPSYFSTPPPQQQQLAPGPSTSSAERILTPNDPEHIIDLTPNRPEHIIDLTPNRTGRTRSLHPKRSQSLLVAEPRLAEPVTSPEGALRSLDEAPELSHVLREDFFTASPPVGSPPPQSHGRDSTSPPHITRSPSSNSLSTSLSSLPGAKWMSTLLRGGSGSDAPQHQHTGQARPALESIFSHDEQAQRDGHAHGHGHGGHSVSPARHGRITQDDQPQSHGWRQSFAPQHAQTMPGTQPVTFKHGSAFAPKPPTAGTSFSSPNYLGTAGVGGGLGAPGGLGGGGSSMLSVSSTASPFGPHVYVPPTGAPGYLGEGYGWDKGFSEELEAERRKEMEAAQGPSEDPAAGSSMLGSTQQVPYNDSTSFSRAMPGRYSPSQDSAVVSPSGGHGSASEFSSFSRGPTRKGGDGGWGSSLFGFGSLRSKPGVVPPQRASVSPSHDLRGASASEGDLRGYSSHPRSGEGDKDGGMGDFIERKAGNVELVGRKASSSPVLSPEIAGQIRSYLPALSRLPKKWTLIYSLDQDGISLNTLYTRCEAHATRRPKPGESMANNAAMLLVVKDADGAIFGAWLAEGIRYIKGGKGYYGGGESFLWKYTNDTLKVFKVTGKNKYIALCEPEYISCGGGDGHYGFYLDSSLFDGSSAPCPTFDNEPLCSPGPKKGVSVTFECVGLEVWGMGP